MSERDGIPVAWVPSQELLTSLVSADLATRRKLLESSEAKILDDVDQAVGQSNHSWVKGDQELAQAAIRAYRQGHVEAAMALAVSLTEPLAKWASDPRVKSFASKEEMKRWKRERPGSPYKWAKYELGLMERDASPFRVKDRALLAPIPRFFEEFHTEQGDPTPELLSRHLVAHRPEPAHFNPANSLVALMLVASLLRESDDWSREVEFMDAETDDDLE